MIEVFQSAKSGKWYWRYRAKNGHVTMDGAEGYSTRSNAKRAARRAGIALMFGKVVVKGG